MTDPEPAVVPVKVTEQLVTPDVVDKLQVGELREPPVVPAVSVNITEAPTSLVQSGGHAAGGLTQEIQQVPPNDKLQLTFPTLMDVLSFNETVTVTFAVELIPLMSVLSPYTTLFRSPEPAVVPVKVTEQLVTPDVVDKLQVGELREPPVVPAVSVN